MNIYSYISLLSDLLFKMVNYLAVAHAAINLFAGCLNKPVKYAFL